MYQLVCQYCKTSFERNRKTFKYCSKRCAYDDRIGKPRHPNSGKKRTKKPKKFVCKHCNKSFKKLVYPSTQKSSTLEFCSPTCRNKARAIKKIPCPVCEKPFTPQVHMTGSVRKKYCSKKCAYKKRKDFNDIEKDIIKNYAKLGADYFINKYKITRNTVYSIAYKHNVTLDPDIYRKKVHEAAREYMSTPNNPNWQGGITHQEWGEDWEKQRKKTLKRDKHKCQVCFKKGNVVHHIKPRRLFNKSNIRDMNKLSNLITLCDKHHVPVEIGKIPCPLPRG